MSYLGDLIREKQEEVKQIAHEAGVTLPSEAAAAATPVQPVIVSKEPVTEAPTQTYVPPASSQPTTSDSSNEQERKIADLKSTNVDNTHIESRDDSRNDIEQGQREREVWQQAQDIVNRIIGNNAVIVNTSEQDERPEQQNRQVESQDADSRVVVEPDFAALVNARNLERQTNSDLNPRVEPNRLAELKRNFENSQQRTLDQGKQMALDQLYSQYAALGINPYDDPMFQQSAESISNMTELPSTIRDRQRRFSDGNGSLASPNVLGFTSQQMSSDATKDLYEYLFEQDAIDRQEHGRKPYVYRNVRQETPEILKNLPGVGDQISQWWEEGVDPRYIDDGYSSESNEAPYMTGDRYLEYIETLGIPGRDTALINPNALYSKQDEMENYGFVPYLVSDEGYDRFHDEAAANTVNNLFNDFANLRRDNTNYTYNYDNNEIDGKDFDRRYDVWLSKLDRDKEVFDDPNQVTEDSVPLTLMLHDEVTGENVYAPNKGKWGRDNNGNPVLRFGGDPADDWYFSGEEDFNNSVNMVEAGDDHQPLYWQNLDPLVLEDGTKIRADKAMDLFKNKDQYADYGGGGWARPVANDPFTDGFAPWVVDMALGSAPLWSSVTAAPQAIASAWSNLHGFEAGARNDNGEYQLLSAQPTGSQKLISAAASAGLPATERLWGNILGAGRLLPGWKRIEERFPDVTEHPLTQWAAGTLGEGIEEIPGNLVEEAQSTGDFLVGDFFANPMYYDENNKLTKNPILPNGEQARKAYDSQGREIRDRDTSFEDRVGNFMDEAPLSMLGGSILGGAFGGLNSLLNGAARQYRERRDERNDIGYNLVIPEEVREYTRRQQEGGE